MNGKELHAFEFTVLRQISSLPVFPGAQWYGMFGTALDEAGLVRKRSLASAGIGVTIIDIGKRGYETGDIAKVALLVPPGFIDPLRGYFRRTRRNRTGTHFAPGDTIELLRTYPVSGSDRVTVAKLKPEAERLKTLTEFSICFVSPFRVRAPRGSEIGHRFCDSRWFANGIGTTAALAVITEKSGGPLCSVDLPVLTSHSGLWVDMDYRNKSIGGYCGTLRFRGGVNEAVAFHLVQTQYLGCGKNTSFGFGRFRIPELDDVREVELPTPHETVAEIAFSKESLRVAAESLNDGASGVDLVAPAEAVFFDDNWFHSLETELKTGRYRHTEYKKVEIPKPTGGTRSIVVPTVKDRIVHRSIKQELETFFDYPDRSMFGPSAIAFRRGVSRSGSARRVARALRAGYTWCVKADIRTFFQSVSTAGVTDLLMPFLYGDPLMVCLRDWFASCAEWNIPGLPQGSPVSPILSNLFLSSLDREVASLPGSMFFRYCDDFLIMADSEARLDDATRVCGEVLARLGLSINEEKTMRFFPGGPVTFIGYRISESEIRESTTADVGWTRVSAESLEKSRTLYITPKGVRATTRGANVVLRDAQNSTTSIPWKSLSELFIVGRHSIDGTLVFRALAENIPVFFVDPMGDYRGRLSPASWDAPDHRDLQKSWAESDQSLSYCRAIVRSKINNSARMLIDFGRDPGDFTGANDAVDVARDAESLRGYEGSYSRRYFGELRELVQPFEFVSRMYHPPIGEVNTLLSFGYTMLYRRCSMFLIARGLDPTLGVFHRRHGRHDALSSDIMESFRFLVDGMVVDLLKTGNIQKANFIERPWSPGQFRLDGNGFRVFVRAFEDAFEKEIKWQHGAVMTGYQAMDRSVQSLLATLKTTTEFQPPLRE